LALAVYYRLARLETEGFAGRGLESFGFEVPSLRIFRPDRPAGIWPVRRRALSVNANHRPASTGEFLQQLERAAERVTSRPLSTQQVGCVKSSERTSGISAVPTTVRSEDSTHPTASEPSLWQRVVRRLAGEATLESSNVSPQLTLPTAVDVGWQTVAGRAKSALGAVNQDCAVVQREPVRDRDVLLMIVADGVTHARVGAGERASGLACEVLVASIREQIRSCPADAEPAWPGILDRACQSASEAVVAEALSLPDRPAQISDNDLMSTTALLGVLDGSDLYLANVGDSRAYLVANGLAEQLTVDGDVAASQLAQGTPPEQVQELGTAGKALRFCLGACRETDDGQLVAELERARPQIGHWRIEPGDTFVLCSDGLVEERVFLEPEDLVRIVDAHRDLASQGLAEQLVAAADTRQRLPSETEPNGYGDNITCIVLRLVEGPPPHDASSRKG
ncbi:MAG: protein phosphatase 2C domain-containing protein, partial [Candidatus Saccharimonas sp.]|nr:protein phosphatase 2C domain-containing protein [Planctomycetaceae bacterium]